MSGPSRYTRAISAEVGEIERRLQSLQKNLERIGTRTSNNARDTAKGLGDAVASALFGWADRFAKARVRSATNRWQSAAMPPDSANFGAKFGKSALTTVSDETERHPLFALAVAVGVGLLIGMVSRSRG